MDSYDDYDFDDGMSIEESLDHEELGVFTIEQIQRIEEIESQEHHVAQWVTVQMDLVPIALRTLHDGQISIRHRAASFIELTLEEVVRTTPPEIENDMRLLHLTPQDALTVLGYYYYNGTLGHHDYEKAREYYEKAEAKGSLQATLALGYFYQYGRGVEKDYKKAFWYYSRANLGALDLPEARYKVADMYFDGLAVEKNEKLAVRIYQEILANLKDDDEWLMDNVEHNRESLYRRLARAYKEGRGVERSPEKALEYYEKLEIIHYRDYVGRAETPYYSPAAHLDSVQQEIAALRKELDGPRR